MTAETAAAPIAGLAGEVDLAGYAFADQSSRIGLHHFCYELMSGSSGETVVAALKLEVGGADAAYYQTEQGMAFGATRNGHVADGNLAIFQVDCEHPLVISKNRTCAARFIHTQSTANRP